jgi:predicted small lipoprotein YifL/outer membrane protein assembly factor BamE (lipoprotein component of BamABCDE complex)
MGKLNVGIVVALIGTLTACGAAAPPPVGPVEKPAASAEEQASVEKQETATEVPAGLTAESKALPTRDQLIAKAPSLEMFPELEELEAQIGKPLTSGKFQRRVWYYDPEKSTGENSITKWHCPSIDLVRTPTGGTTTHSSMMNSDDCKNVKLTKAKEKVFNVEADSQDLPFDEAVKAFEGALGKPALQTEVTWQAWQYADKKGTCQLVLVVPSAGQSGVTHAFWICHARKKATRSKH